MTPPPPRAIRPREAVLAAALFVAGAILCTWPHAAHLRDGMTDVWDAKFTAWVMHWDFAQTFRNPLRLFHANIFHPAPYALAFSENLYAAAVFGFPLYAAGVSTLAAYNVSFLLGMALSGWGAWALARWVTADAAAALLAGWIYAFNPWRLAQIPHIQFQWGVFFPLFLLFLLRYLEEGRRDSSGTRLSRDAILFALFFACNVLSNLHYALFGGMTALVVLAFHALSHPKARQRTRRALLALGGACLAVSPFLWPYFQIARLYGGRRSAGEMQFFSGRWLDFLTAGAENKLYAPLTQKWGKPEGDFFPGLIPVALAVFALIALRGPRSERLPHEDVSPARRKTVRALDAATLILLALWLASTLSPGLRLGPISLGDAGRILVFATAAVLLRLLLAFPPWSRFRNLSDFVRRQRLGERPLLFLCIAALGVVVALGGNTPYYRFLFQSFGAVMRGIRVPGRGIVIFHIGLAVLAAWGLATLARRARRSGVQVAVIAAALLLTAFEYRAFPVPVHPVKEAAPPVYEWLGKILPPGALIELPFGTDFDVEYEFRSTVHWHPLLNGYSGSGPPHYHELFGLFQEAPIRDVALARARELGAGLIIFHPHASVGGEAKPDYAKALLRWTGSGRIEALASFPHEEATDYVFRFSDGPPFEAKLPPGTTEKAAREFEEFRNAETRLSPPFGVIDHPREGQAVAAGSFGFGWALDDSGVARVRVSAQDATPTDAALGGEYPGVPEVFPGFPDSKRPGYGFNVPALPAGEHTIIVTIVGKDGGEARLHRRIRIR